MSDNVITVLAEEPIARINPHVYGHFAEHLGGCVYPGIWVGEDSAIPNIGGIRKDVVDALRRISPPILRWPGGCFADDYHWQDGIGPRNARPRTVNLWWGEDIETNQFGTDEFLAFCGLIGAEPYICGNVGSGSPYEMRAWIEYANFGGDSDLARRRAANGSAEPYGVRCWGVGNENWGCGGTMTPEDYGAEYKRFSTYLHDIGGTPLFLIACGPNGNNPDWTRRLLGKLYDGRRAPRLHGFAAHYYCGTAGTATEYTTDEWYALIQRAMGVEGLITQQRAIMDGFDPERKVGLIIDEWGAWHKPTPGYHPRHLWQQNTLRDALVAATSLDIYNRHADKVIMSNIAQTINVLQAMVLTEGDRMVTTPTYHVYEMYRHHQGGTSLRTRFAGPEITFTYEGQERTLPALSGSASVQDGVLTLSVVNTDASQTQEAVIVLQGASAALSSARVLTHADIHAHNTFEAPDTVVPVHSAPLGNGNRIACAFAPASVTVFRFQLGS